MLQNAYSLAKIGANTAENEQRFAKILPIGRLAVGAALSEKGVAVPLGGDGSAGAAAGDT